MPMAAALLVSCSQADKLRLEQLEADYAALQGRVAPEVPDAAEPVTGDPSEYSISFDRPCYGVDAGSSVNINFSLPESSEVEVLTKDGWTASVSAANGTEGTITVTAPDPASPTEVVVTARSHGGKMVATNLPLKLRNPYSDATRPVMRALGYYSFKPANATAENFRKLADAGLNMVTVETDEERWQEQIALAGQAGLKVLAVLIGRCDAYYNNPDSDTRLSEAVNWLKNRPEVVAYHVFDEPGVQHAHMLKTIKDRVEELDPTRPVYINFGPEASTEWMGVPTYYEYVNTLADYLDLKQISYDQYPIFPGRIQENWHKCLGIIADAAKRRGIDFWAFAASCWINKEAATQLRERPNTYNLLLQIYTNLAYGAQTIQYFTIQDYGGTDFAPIMRDGTWTEAYDYLKEANLQMQKRAFVFTGCNVAKIRRAGDSATIGDMLSVLDYPAQIKNITVPWSATVSFIENNGNEYIAVVNDYWSAEQPLSIELADSVYSIEPDGSFTICQSGVNNFTIPKGGMMVFKYK